MLKKLLSIGTHVPGTMRDEKAIQMIRLYELFPIPHYPLKDKEVLNEIEHYLETYEKSYPGYILLQFFGGKISKEYLSCCEENGITPLTAQGKYKFKTSPTVIFTEEFWKKAKFYDIKPSDVLCNIPMSKKEENSVKVYTDDMNITVRELIDIIKLAKVKGDNWPDTDKILVPITGEIPEPGWIVRFIRMLQGHIIDAEAANIIKYNTILEPLIMKAIGSLEQREAAAVDMYLKDEMSKAAIAPLFNVTQSRIHQILARAFRKLRHPSRSSEILYIIRMPEDTNKDVLECIEKYYKDTKKETKIVKIIDILTNNPIRLINENKFIQAMFFVSPDECFNKLKDYGISDDDNVEPVLPELIKFDRPGLDTTIEDMDLSVRAFNCLKRAELYTIKDVISYSHEYGFIKIRNLGRKSANEIIDKLECLGFGDLLPRDPLLSDDEQEEV